MASSRNSVIPERSMNQRLSALQAANATRSYRSQLKKDVKAGRILVATLLLYPPEKIKTMKIFDLLISSPRMGKVKANRLLSACRISPSKTIEGMTKRQRDEMVALLQRRH